MTADARVPVGRLVDAVARRAIGDAYRRADAVPTIAPDADRRRRTRPARPGGRPDDRSRPATPGLLYVAFLLRLDADRSTVTTLNQALQGAAEAGDRPAARRASIDILDFADAEQDWLRDHPPAACYAGAHAAADTMLEAYAATADAFIAWADAGRAWTASRRSAGRLKQPASRAMP